MKQGYNARLDDSLGAKHGKKSQSMKARRDESEGVEKSMGKRKFSGNKSSAQGRPEGTHKVLKHMNADLAFMPVIDREKDAMHKGDM
tara:strand:- start:657 stop:917 length:261 start_codon:yes stop_codon:yes gene_type:complete